MEYEVLLCEDIDKLSWLGDVVESRPDTRGIDPEVLRRLPAGQHSCDSREKEGAERGKLEGKRLKRRSRRLKARGVIAAGPGWGAYSVRSMSSKSPRTYGD
jgi:hypothetical protein